MLPFLSFLSAVLTSDFSGAMFLSLLTSDLSPIVPSCNKMQFIEAQKSNPETQGIEVLY